MPLETIIAGVMIAALVLYALLGGADYGGGVWDLFAFGPRARAQRRLIAEAISPVWEANHVWLILVIVILFTAFPPAFAAIATALHIPITLLLIGIVLRGAAFTFRTYDVQRDDVQRRWSLVFSIASIITPILLGTILGAIASGTIRVENGSVTSGFFNSWLAPFPFAVGCFALALFAFLAAVYLTLETRERELQEGFRRRALASGVAVGLLALTVFMLAREGADCARRHQSKLVGVGSACLHRTVRDECVLFSVDEAIQAGARLCRSAGDVDLAWLGIRAIPAHRRTRHHDRLSRRTAGDAATPARRTHCRRDFVVPVVLLSVPNF